METKSTPRLQRRHTKHCYTDINTQYQHLLVLTLVPKTLIQKSHRSRVRHRAQHFTQILNLHKSWGGGGRNYVSFSFYKQETKIQMFSMAGLTSGQRQEQKPTSTSTLRCTKWDRVGVGLSGDSVDIRRPMWEEREAVNVLSSTQQ